MRVKTDVLFFAQVISYSCGFVTTYWGKFKKSLTLLMVIKYFINHFQLKIVLLTTSMIFEELLILFKPHPPPPKFLNNLLNFRSFNLFPIFTKILIFFYPQFFLLVKSSMKSFLMHKKYVEGNLASERMMTKLMFYWENFQKFFFSCFQLAPN